MRSQWFYTFGPVGNEASRDGGSTRLVCFPHAGGAASAYVPLSRVLTPAVRVLAVQYPGRQNRLREQPLSDIGRLADILADEVHEVDEGPFAFFGHSMGAVLAYEVARRLEARGAPGPVRLFLSGRNAPARVPGKHDRMRSDADVLRTVRLLGGTTASVLEDPELLAMVLPALRADYHAIGSYRWSPCPKLSVPFTVLVGDRDPVASRSGASAWCELTSAPTDVRVFPGGHFYLDHNVDGVAETVRRVLSVPTAVTGARAAAE
ncbi:MULTISPECIES: alpha/beta fold hydrolase [Streptomyces]|uniref:Alpha/beta fold hydrolase n=1 Tax=Streptomyces yunnanensis TaxID=156453 RepID=A0ABY8A126_9ACTN|nr:MULTISPECIES: alpha/beta fold hydrolase [Streptomyces]AJC52683.1 thioesterase II [Streptomyces sp. 769]AJC61856.1 thioesterase II [Streptomyces sp. 769]WEB37919.1 alpha/beta fold hydrolase [Streptomyces yunnanensis]